MVLTLDGPLAAPIENVELDDDADIARTHVRDVASELPALLHQLSEQNVTVTDIAVHTPSLHNVFLHLTGRELRDG